MRTIELLSPAKNLACGIAAIDHGADAVYIGAPRFGARAAAGNSVADIATLCRYAHQFGAKVYVTVNTIVFDHETDDTLELLGQLREAGADAVLLQDMGVAALAARSLGPSLPLHASTQTDNRTARKVRWLRDQGFSRVVLARELTAEEIRAIHEAVPDVELEVFVHGALCVSFSGVCYASQHCFGRSANRGECAQFCRMAFDLVDAGGNTIEQQRHLLSLKDLCQIDRLETIIRAGAVSLKIEGRLKDVAYVKNVTAAYSQALDEIIARHPGQYRRASEGRCTYHFEPNLEKTFNRGFTHYFLDGRKPDIFSPDTPKAIGEYVGYVKELRGHALTVAGTAAFANGDGLCFINAQRQLEGFRVNRAEGNRLFPLRMPEALHRGMALYRNNDVAFEKIMGGNTAERRIPVEMTLEATDEGFCLSMRTRGEGSGLRQATAHRQAEKQTAQKPQRENIAKQLGKLGGTPYECVALRLVPEHFPFFIPSSLLSELRRQVVERMRNAENETTNEEWRAAPEGKALVAQPALSGQTADDDCGQWLKAEAQPPYVLNIANREARRFYEQQGLSAPAWAFEKEPPAGRVLIMQCRHCLKYSLGYCQRRGGKAMPWREPLSLRLADGRLFPLEFRCKECQMNVFAKPNGQNSARVSSAMAGKAAGRHVSGNQRSLAEGKSNGQTEYGSQRSMAGRKEHEGETKYNASANNGSGGKGGAHER